MFRVIPNGGVKFIYHLMWEIFLWKPRVIEDLELVLFQNWFSYAIFLESLVVETFEGYFMFDEETLPLWLFDLLTDQ